MKGNVASVTTPPEEYENPAINVVKLTGTLAYALGSRSCATRGLASNNEYKRINVSVPLFKGLSVDLLIQISYLLQTRANKVANIP